jgi:hypothetical protein
MLLSVLLERQFQRRGMKNKKAPWIGAFRGLWWSVSDYLKPVFGGAEHASSQTA